MATYGEYSREITEVVIGTEKVRFDLQVTGDLEKLKSEYKRKFVYIGTATTYYVAGRLCTHKELYHFFKKDETGYAPEFVELSEAERKLIKFCKLHYAKDPKYKKLKGTWPQMLKPLFEEIYGWAPDTDYNDYLSVLFAKLLDIHLKIKQDFSGSEKQLKEIFEAVFGKRWAYQSELPIERGIEALCGQIQNTPVLDKAGNKRFEL